MVNALETGGFPRAEEALRLLAAAVGAARLYPAASNLPQEAVARFTERANELTMSEPLRYSVDRHGFRVGDTPIAPGQSQVVALAEALHAMQAGQLIVVQGFSEAETAAFIEVANTDPASIRTSGGARKALIATGVSHIALIEVSLRTGEEGGLLGIDPASAPLEEIAVEVAAAVERRAIQAKQGPADDEMAQSIGSLETATRELARERVAAALMRLDEQTRVRVLGLSLNADSEGRRMDGMLEVIARMKPAALARLLTLVAAQVGTSPNRVAAALPLPPETAQLLALMLAPTSDIEPEAETSASDSAVQVAEVMATQEDTTEIERQVAVAAPALSSARALATAMVISRTHPDADTVKAIGDVLPQAAGDGAFATVREALRRLDEIATDPALSEDVVRARLTLAEPAVLADVCRVPATDADAAIAGEILQAAGPAGAEALLDCYVRSGEQRRSLMKPVLRGMSEGVLGIARERLRSADPPLAVAIVYTLGALGDRRAVPVVVEMVNHLDETVRFAAVKSLATMQSPEAASALIRALNHREPETQRYVVRQIGEAKLASAVPALSRALEDINMFGRTYETRKDIIRTLESIGTPEAEKALRAYAQHTIRLGRKTRELRKQAIAVADSLAKKRGVSAS